MTTETTPRVGRPPVGPRITLRIPTDLVARLDAYADRIGTTRSNVIRLAVELAVDSAMFGDTPDTYTETPDIRTG